jgi:cysteinyl-tRNA synthetase
MDSLNILRADHYPRCTEYVDSMIHIIEDLITKKHAYAAKDGVYFHVESAPEKYGLLTGQSIDAVRQGAGGRVEGTGDTKRDHKDFALWKQAKPGEPTWPSPWGEGRPGWHIECSAMSLDHFGVSFDIHGGGHDLRFPHHEAEIFQSECHTGHSPLAGYWLHNGFVNIDGEKMSKSLGNFWTIQEIRKKINPMVLRFALVNAHYRSPIDMNEQLLKDAERNYNRIIEAYASALRGCTEGQIQDLPMADITSMNPLSKSLGLLEKMGEGFARAMDDDFNSREAVAKVLAATKELQRILSMELDEVDSRAVANYAKDWLEETAGQILGILPEPEVVLAEPEEDPRRTEIAPQVEELLSQRTDARSNKDWPRADAIRDDLAALGVVVKDTPDGPTWDFA